MSYAWDFESLIQFKNLWADGIHQTLLLSLLSIATGTILGIALACGMVRRKTLVRRILRWSCKIYIDIFRAIPAYVLMGTIFLCVPTLFGVLPSPFETAWIALALNLAPFAAEVIRAGIESVPTVQFESARMMGFKGLRLARYIIGPQALQRILPPMVGQYVTTVKLSSLAATIGVLDIWNVTTQVVTATSRPIEARLVGAALYCLILIPCLWFVDWLEKRVDVAGLGQLSER